MDVNNIRRLYLEGHSTVYLEKTFNISQGSLNAILKDCRRSHKEASLVSFKRKHSAISPIIINMFDEGISVKGISAQAGIGRSTVKRILEVNGITPRNQSEAMIEMASNSTEEERKARVKSANSSVRGRRKSESFKSKQAIAKFHSKSKVGIGEPDFIKWINKRGFECESQWPIGPYNIDIMVGNLAVEIHVNSGNPHNMPFYRTRIKYILNRGYSVLYVKVSKARPLIDASADYAISMIEASRLLPPASSEYRMIRGDGDFMTAMCLDGDHLSVIQPSG